MHRSGSTMARTIPIALLIGAGLLYSAYGAPARSAMDDLDRLVKARAHESSDPRILVRMSELYLEVGQEGDTDVTQRRAAFDEGARIAQRALDLQEANADAHYLYAANLGSAAQLKGLTASALTVRELKLHVARALELRKDHAAALHMMGRMLDELPWILGGDAEAALRYLKHAVHADPGYEHARLDLAKAYLKRHDVAAARLELQTLVGGTPTSHEGTASRYQMEGRTLLVSLQEREKRRP
jgi:tetratricopeptide (TPR) repeat protein